MKKIVVTRHPALVEYLLEIGMIRQGEFALIAHATPENLFNQDVFGVLPLSLAYFCHYVTEIPLELTPEDRGKELSIERLREIAGAPQKYSVRKIGNL